MLLLSLSIFAWVAHGSRAESVTDLSTLSANQRQVWLDAVTRINQTNGDLSVVIVELDYPVSIPLFENQHETAQQTRSLFKQDVHKQVHCHLHENHVNPAIFYNPYDRCHGALISREASISTAGVYVYTDVHRSLALGIIAVKTIDWFQWFNGTKPYPRGEQLTVKNGTTLSLAVETLIYFNSDSDLPLYNERIEEIIREAHMFIDPDGFMNNLSLFFALEHLTCQRHRQIVNDELRLLSLICLVDVTFHCPLSKGSTCWLENKRMSNLVLNMDSSAFITDRTFSVQIEV